MRTPGHSRSIYFALTNERQTPLPGLVVRQNVESRREKWIIICAEHGQSPIDKTKLRAIGGGQPATLIGASEAFDISDDGSLIWLTDQELTPSVVALLSEPANQATLGIQEIFAGQALRNK